MLHPIHPMRFDRKKVIPVDFMSQELRSYCNKMEIQNGKKFSSFKYISKESFSCRSTKDRPPQRQHTFL